MRSYSSLLGHLLGSHRDVRGYYEHHVSYRDETDLAELRRRLVGTSHRRPRRRPRYVFDKLLHDEYVVSDEVLQRPDVVALLSVREPRSTVRSIVAMWQREQVDAGLDDAVEHLITRYRTIGDLAVRCPRPAALFADSLVDETASTLVALQRFLDLRSPITRTYRVFEHTGRPGFGDPGESISSGVVEARHAAAPIAVDQESEQRLVEAYRRVAAALEAHCPTVIGRPIEM